MPAESQAFIRRAYTWVWACAGTRAVALWYTAPVQSCSLPGQATLRVLPSGRIYVPLLSEGGSQQRARTVKVGFRRAGWHLEPLSDLGEAQLVPVAQEDHRAQLGR